LAAEHVKADEQLARPTLCGLLEGILRSFRFVQDFIVERQPPAFAVLTLLLDAPECILPVEGFREAVMAETTRLCALVDGGEILGRHDQLRLYRRVLYEARRSDLAIDASESALLGVLRREIGVTQVEHFLLEHHSDLQEFWNNERCFLHELHALRSAGLVFAREGTTLLAEDVAPLVRQALGIDMPTASARRLFAMLSSADLVEALGSVHAKTSGTKEERVERLLLHMVQPRTLLRSVSLGTLRDLCRDAGAAVSGSKDELVERIVTHFAASLDQRPPDEPEPEPTPEARALEEARFRRLFASLKGQELAHVLAAFPGLRQSGTKDVRVGTLWESHRSESTLLSVLMNRDIEDVLHRLGLRLGGSKPERIHRLVEHFARIDPSEVSVPEDVAEDLVYADTATSDGAWPVEE
jgi:hypothetical protein